MFPKAVYHSRRKRLAADVGSGIVLFLGNGQSPMNYADNLYPFRQDSSFLYFWGLDMPDLAAAIDIDASREIIFGDDMTLEESVWSGASPSLSFLCEKTDVAQIEPADHLTPFIQKARSSGRTVHILPQYRADNIMAMSRLLNTAPGDLGETVSPELIRAVVAQRSIKSAAEVDQMESALDISREMHMTAMRMTSPGMYELEVVSAMESIAYARGGSRMAYPTIFTVRGEILHNQFHGNIMQAGNLVVNDSGAESPMHYASDITRTIPVGGSFSTRQKEIYRIVLASQEAAIQSMRPGTAFRDIHLLSCRVITEGLQALGLMKGDVDASVAAGAHALFQPAGLGHMIGLDVHDMEGLGEDLVGYTDTIKRSDQFGTRNLRLARPLEEGFVLTVEPGIYFISRLIDRWRSENKFSDFIDYDRVEAYKGFGGVRIEDNVLVTRSGARILGKPIPKRVEEVEALASS
ncbi:MAG: aminopeptidase P family protein [Deltaproteobacteria bacterium]|nr:aminopeptidase P family protein [Deltaproteobacteria bacterium]